MLLAAFFLGQAGSLIRADRRRVVAGLVEDDPAPCYLADEHGTILSRNAAARGTSAPDAAQDGKGDDTIAAALARQLADAPALLARLARQALRHGRASDALSDGRGSWRLSARRIAADTLLWRVEGQAAAEDDTALPLATLGPDGRVLSCNAALQRLVGGVPPDLCRLVLDRPLVAGKVHRIATATGPVERLVLVVPGPGRRRDLHLLPLPETGPPCAKGEGWSTLEGLPVPLLCVSPDGLVRAANCHARALLPVPAQGETRLSDLLEGLGRPVGEWVADVAAGRPSVGPQFLRGTGENRDLFIRVSLNLAGPPGHPHVLAVLDDVTELKSLEAQFVQSQKMQALGQLAGGVAHDFNNLLTAISGHSDLLLLRRGPRDPDYPDLMQIRENVNRAADLVGQLLAFSRKQSMLPETLDLRTALSDLTHLLDRLVGERVRLSLHHDPTPAFIRADKRQLEQVIMNLVVNARDAMPKGGDIRIETAHRHLAEPMTVDRAAVPAGDYVLVRVTDEGTGIPPDRLPKIFEPFYTTKKPGEGTGLGLSTVYGIVKQTGGYIFVDSAVGRGSTFTLWFPGHAEGSPCPAASSAPSPVLARSAPGTVLVVEDEAGVRAFVARALRMRGHTVLEAGSGEAALSLLADSAAPVDLILTDVILPDADGPTWVRAALADRPAPAWSSCPATRRTPSPSRRP